jgi:hypothetical protein
VLHDQIQAAAPKQKTKVFVFENNVVQILDGAVNLIDFFQQQLPAVLAGG